MFVHKAVVSFPDLRFMLLLDVTQQNDLHDIIEEKWPSGVSIHAAGVLFKIKYLGFPHQIDIHWCKANVGCENTIQIHHNGVNHCLVSANISGVFNAYNSIYQGSHNENIKSLLSLFY